jgi:hypothetical protein
MENTNLWLQVILVAMIVFLLIAIVYMDSYIAMNMIHATYIWVFVILPYIAECAGMNELKWYQKCTWKDLNFKIWRLYKSKGWV